MADLRAQLLELARDDLENSDAITDTKQGVIWIERAGTNHRARGYEYRLTVTRKCSPRVNALGIETVELFTGCLAAAAEYLIHQYQIEG